MSDHQNQNGSNSDRRDGRDSELESMLAGLRQIEPKRQDRDRWQAALDDALLGQSEGRVRWRLRSMPRYLEWAVAAAIGFAVATLWGQFRRESLPSHDQDAAMMAQTSSANPEYFDLDATAIHLAANSD